MNYFYEILSPIDLDVLEEAILDSLIVATYSNLRWDSDNTNLTVCLNRELSIEEKTILDNLVSNNCVDCSCKCSELNIKVYTQSFEPILYETNKMAIWIDSSDNNRVYLIFKRADSDQVAVELG